MSLVRNPNGLRRFPARGDTRADSKTRAPTKHCAASPPLLLLLLSCRSHFISSKAELCGVGGKVNRASNDLIPVAHDSFFISRPLMCPMLAGDCESNPTILVTTCYGRSVVRASIRTCESCDEHWIPPVSCLRRPLFFSPFFMVEKCVYPQPKNLFHAEKTRKGLRSLRTHIVRKWFSRTFLTSVCIHRMNVRKMFAFVSWLISYLFSRDFDSLYFAG